MPHSHRGRGMGRPRSFDRSTSAQNTHAESEQSSLYQHLSALVHQPSSSISAAVEKAVQDCDPYGTAGYLVELAQITPPEKQQNLVTFVHELQKVRLFDEKTGKQKIYPEDATGELLWTELPGFGVTWADEWQSLAPTSLNTPTQRLQVENFNIFIARLCASSREKPFDDLLSYAASAFNFAFGPWPHATSEKALGPWDRYRPSDHQDTVRVASLWFIYAGERVWEKVRGIEEGTWVWARWDECGWCRGEWERWKAGLVDSGVRLRNLATREVIVRAIEVMERCERGA